MQPHLTSNEAVIQRIAGTATFLRGRQYALSGAVVSLQRQAPARSRSTASMRSRSR